VIQPGGALFCLRCLMSFIPAAVAIISMLIVTFYPLTTEKIDNINEQLKPIRKIEK
jgi:GPH family glycoside/pentoside/hexuronide:cation symporter